MRIGKKQTWGLLMPIVLLGMAGCGEPSEEHFIAGPKAYVEFYIPSDDPVQEKYKVDASIYRIEGGKRVFEGMTRKNRDEGATKHNRVVVVTPGEHQFEVVVAGGDTPLTIAVDDGVYQPVRIWFSGSTREQLMGMTNKIQFKVNLTADAPIIPTHASGQPAAGAGY
ncbi:MAG: hypothetical protein ACFCUJ_10655 [Thiotrichales bacterium]